MSKKVTRISADEYFLKIASVVAERSTCLRHHMGAVAVKDKHILTTGFNGAPAGVKDCLELGCLRNAQNIPQGHAPKSAGRFTQNRMSSSRPPCTASASTAAPFTALTHPASSARR